MALTVLLTAAPAAVADEPDSPAVDTHPALPADAGWVGWMTACGVGLFVLAAVVGPIVLVRNPRVVADATSHEEDPSADRHER